MEAALGTGLPPLWVRGLRTRGRRQQRLGIAGQVPLKANSEEKSKQEVYWGAFWRSTPVLGRGRRQGIASEGSADPAGALKLGWPFRRATRFSKENDKIPS